MCDKASYRDVNDLIDRMNQRERDMVTPPKKPYDILMERNRRLKECDVTMWFLEEHCELCGAPIFTDGKVCYCKEGCGNHGKRGKWNKENMRMLKDVVR